MDTKEFAAVYHDLERGITAIAYINPYLHFPVPSFRRRDRARVRLGEMVHEIVKQRRGGGQVYQDILQIVMEGTGTTKVTNQGHSKFHPETSKVARRDCQSLK